MFIQNPFDIRIKELASRIIKTINPISKGNDANLVNDVFSFLFELEKEDPSFINQKDWYIIAQVKSFCVHREVLDKVVVYLDEYRLEHIFNQS